MYKRNKGLNRMGRPKLPEGKRRTEVIIIRATVDEWSVINKRASDVGLSISQYIRSKIVHDEPECELCKKEARYDHRHVEGDHIAYYCAACRELVDPDPKTEFIGI